MHRMTRVRFPPFKNAQIRWFIRHYGVDMSECENPEPETYRDFNHFFTRTLQPHARPAPSDPRMVVSPADGELSTLGEIHAGTLLQAKGQTYTLEALLAGDRHLVTALQGGSYATIYLAPHNYHRVHSPLDGNLKRTIFVPGDLFSVNPRTVARVPGIFARNERVIFELDTACGAVALIMVGAICVSSVSTEWDGELTGPGNTATTHTYSHRPTLARGDELARFNMGSTVVMLFPPGAVTWERESLGSCRCNEALARLV